MGQRSCRTVRGAIPTYLSIDVPLPTDLDGHCGGAARRVARRSRRSVRGTISRYTATYLVTSVSIRIIVVVVVRADPAGTLMVPSCTSYHAAPATSTPGVARTADPESARARAPVVGESCA